jgi:hypothetical protein
LKAPSQYISAGAARLKITSSRSPSAKLWLLVEKVAEKK